MHSESRWSQASRSPRARRSSRRRRPASARRACGRAPATARAAAPFDITGHWVSLITDDWVYRMITPAKGDVSYVPLNAEGRRLAEAWDPARDEAAGEQCKGYAAPAIMRLPSRVEISWQDDNTLEARHRHRDADAPVPLRPDASRKVRAAGKGGRRRPGSCPGRRSSSIPARRRSARSSAPAA